MMTKFTIHNVEMVTNPTVGKSQLLFLCSACRLIVVNISEKFRENISNGFQVTGRKRICGRQTDRQTSMPKTIRLPILKV